MKRSLLASVIPALLVVAACNQKYSGFEKTDTGLYYKHIVDNEKTRQIKEGDFVTFQMVYATVGDSVIYDTREQGKPVVFVYSKPDYPGDILEGVGLLSEGDSAAFIVNADSFFVKNMKTPKPEELANVDDLKLLVKIEKVQSMQEREKEIAIETQQGRKIEMEELTKYLAENKVMATPTASGMYYIETKKGTGKQAAPGNLVRVNYIGRLLNGKVFDTSYPDSAKAAGIYNPQRPYQPIEFPLGQGNVIPGWDEGIAYMKEGGRARFIIPSSLGYGNREAGPIPRNSTLLFDVELISVKPAPPANSPIPQDQQ